MKSWHFRAARRHPISMWILSSFINPIRVSGQLMEESQIRTTAVLPVARERLLLRIKRHLLYQQVEILLPYQQPLIWAGWFFTGKNLIKQHWFQTYRSLEKSALILS